VTNGPINWPINQLHAAAFFFKSEKFLS
jgi:hypothetical protein